MRRRLRTRRLLKWAGTVACVLVLAVLALSTGWSLRYVGSPVCLDVVGGGVTVDRARGAEVAKLRPSVRGYWDLMTLPQINAPVWRLTWGIWDHYMLGRVWAFILPLWIPFFILLIPTALLWRLDRRRFPAGHCQECGYDLTGNVSGRCPECGTVINPKQAQRASTAEPRRGGGE